MEKVNVAEKFTLFYEHWSPKIVGALNDSYVKLVKLKGEFIWHHHEAEDELFYVYSGRIVIQLKDQENVELAEGEMTVIPRGVEHCPRSVVPSYCLLFEPRALNTKGD